MNKKILIVDDNNELRQLITITLNCTSYQLINSSSADEALAILLENRPDLIVLDVMMPGSMSGYQLCEFIKNNPLYETIKVILLTARGQQSDIQEGIRVKSDGYLVKPFSPLLLLKKVDELLSDNEIE